MKKDTLFFLAVLAGAALYAWLFWSESMGLNTVLASIFILGAMGKLHAGLFREVAARWAGAGLLFSAAMVVVNNSLIAKGVHIASLAWCVGLAQAPFLRFVWFSGLLALYGVFRAPLAMVLEIFRGRKKSLHWRTLWNLALITAIPTFAVLFFFWLYYFSNSAFAALVDNVLKSVEYWPIWQWPLGRLILALLGASIVYAIGRENPLADKLEAFEANQCQELERKRKKVWWGHSTMALKQTYKISFFTLIALNLLLLVVNLTDVATVWWGIVPETPYELSQFVHTGTYLLIFSILVASSFVALIFWNNLNFFPHNVPLKTAAMIWLAQNVLLALSVGARNYHYIAGYGLAYKRIGVLVFLLLTVIGLISLYLKVRDRKSMFYLLLTNTWAWYIVWMLCATLNWDVLITRYNLRYTREQVDLPYLINDLSDKNLYVLNQEHALIPTNSYEAQQLDNKRKRFEQRLASTTWLSWNWADEVNRRVLKAYKSGPHKDATTK
jgi:hypothetical protein